MSSDNAQRQSYQNLLRAAPSFLPADPLNAFSEFVAFVRRHCALAVNTEVEVMAWLAAANREADLVSVEVLARSWIPYAYDSHAREIRWCLPQGRALQPFFDEYLTHCRQHLINALLIPRSSVQSVLRYAQQLPELHDPSGFIFHVSRCGSTLVSGCMAQFESCSVLSESPLLTDILLASDLTEGGKKSMLRLCVRLQGRSLPTQPHVIVKWNAWDIFYWGLIREIWPQVPVLLLVRNPVEVMASHAKSTGRHMSGDSALAHVHEFLASSGGFSSVLAYRIKVLEALMTKMLQVRGDSRVILMDYTKLDASALIEICTHFGVDVTPQHRSQVQKQLTRDSKRPSSVFQPDSEEKRGSLLAGQIRNIVIELEDLYLSLIQNSH